MTCTSTNKLNDIPISQVTGDTNYTSEYLDFGFYDHVWYIDNTGLEERQPGRLLGVEHRVGLLMTYHILTEIGQIATRSSVQRVTNLEKELHETKEKFKAYNQAINTRLKHSYEIFGT